MFKRIESVMEAFIFKSRWILAPFFLGLILGIVFIFIKFSQEVWHLVTHVVELSEHDLVIGVLALVDMALVGSLLLMIIFSGYEIFVSKIDIDDHTDKPSWMGKVNFSGLKLKLIGAIVAISAIDLLKVYMDMSHDMTQGEQLMIMWKVLIHLCFVVSGLIFAFMEKISGNTSHN